MYKLKDIIKSGRGNAKINRFINRYILSRDEKKDVIQEIKNSKGDNSSTTYNRYYRLIKPLDDSVVNAIQLLMKKNSNILKVEYNGNYKYAIASVFSEDISGNPDIKAFQFTPVLMGYIYGDSRLCKDINDFIYLYGLTNNNSSLLPILDYIEEITADEFFNLNEL